jgi:hypothetical protein
MMETLIAISVGVVVGGGILTLVYRILVGDREDARVENALAELAKRPQNHGAQSAVASQPAKKS